MKAIAKFIRISPKKVNIVADLVRHKNVTEALNILNFTPKKAASLLAKVIKSAATNSEHNFKQNPTQLYIKEIYVNEGPTMKRIQPVSRGRSHPILKRTSHIKVYLEIATNSVTKTPDPEKKQTIPEKTNPRKKNPLKTSKKQTNPTLQ